MLDKGTMLDGEIVAPDREGRPAFSLRRNYQAAAEPVCFCVFDLLALRGETLLHLPLRERRRLPESVGMRRIGGPIRLSAPLHATAKELIGATREQYFEGMAPMEFTEWTAAGRLRHSRFAGPRDDKDAREVVRETAA